MRQIFKFSKEELKGEAQHLANETQQKVVFYPESHERGEWDYMTIKNFKENGHTVEEDHEVILPTI